MTQIIKRDGSIVKFDKQKIINAILAAFNEVENETSEYAKVKANNIANYIEEVAKTKTLTVEEVQDYVEKGLMSTKRKDVAKAYMLYREKRRIERNKRDNLFKTIKNHLDAADVQNSNANVDELSFGGRKGEASNALMKQLALDEYMSPLARERHLNNEIYTHDLDSYILGCHNCLTIPFDKLLENGFNTRQTDIRPANSINSAFQLLAVIFQIQSLQQFG